MRDTFLVKKQVLERFAVKLVCCWTYYLDLMSGGDSNWAIISFILFFLHFTFTHVFVLANYFVTIMRAEEEITRIHFRPRVARFFVLF